jgi:energy-coupling factor transporter ATP-binding protein EcfA2
VKTRAKVKKCAECGQPLRPPYERKTLDFYVAQPGEIVVIVGVTNSGKSTLAKRWASYLLQQQEPVVVVTDFAAEWSRHGIMREWCPLGPMHDESTVTEFLTRPEMLRKRRLALAIRPDDVLAPAAGKAEEFKAVLPYMRQRKGRTHLFFEEAGKLSTWLGEEFGEVATTWRKDGPVPYFLAQYWTQLPKEVRSQASTIVSFQQTDSTCLGFLARETTRAFARDVAGLAQGEHAVFVRRGLNPDLLADLD